MDNTETKRNQMKRYLIVSLVMMMFMLGSQAQVLSVCNPNQLKAAMDAANAAAKAAEAQRAANQNLANSIKVTNVATQQQQCSYQQLATYNQQLAKDAQQQVKDIQQMAKDQQQIAKDAQQIDADKRQAAKDIELAAREKALQVPVCQLTVPVKPVPPPSSVTYTLTTVATKGTISRSVNQTTYPIGSTVILTATAISGFAFSGWSGDVACCDRDANPVTVTMNGNKLITANFQAANVTASEVSVSPAAMVQVNIPGLYVGAASAGVMQIKVNGTIINGFCIDLHHFSSSQPLPYNVVEMDDAPGAPGGPMSANDAQAIRNLWSLFYEDAMKDGNKAAALQVAIWTVVLRSDKTTPKPTIYPTVFGTADSAKMIAMATAFTGSGANVIGLTSPNSVQGYVIHYESLDKAVNLPQ